MKLLLPLALLALFAASPIYAAIGPVTSDLREAIVVKPVENARCVCGGGGCVSRRVCSGGRCSTRRICR
jgi:hypothetical protein